MSKSKSYELTIHYNEKQGYLIVDQTGKRYCEPISVESGFYDTQGKILITAPVQTKYYSSLEEAKNKALELMSEIGAENIREEDLVNV